MPAITLSRPEYLVILDILHADRIWGLEDHPLFPSDRDEHLALIHRGIRQLETRGLVKIEGGRHIIEQRLLDVVSVVVQPSLVITTIRDQAAIGGQLYLHYQANGDVVEQLLPDENHYTLGQLPGIAAAMDRILRLFDIPTAPCEFAEPAAITREHFFQIYGQIESGDRSGALTSLLGSGWPDPFARGYMATQANQQLAGLVNLMALKGGEPAEYSDLTLIHDKEFAWLVTVRPGHQSQHLMRQVNAASFRKIFEETYNSVLRQIREKP